MEETKKKRFKSKPLGQNQGKIMVSLPNELYVQFKAYCGSYNTNMAEAIRQMIMRHLIEEKIS